ncbi:MAG: hypothetical protein AAGG48_13840 [Planctomycetota bacterium]
MTKLTSPALFAIAVMMAAPTSAQAGHDTPIYRAADHYLDVVDEFEEATDDSRYLSRSHRRLTDDFEDLVEDLRHNARRPERRRELINSWRKTQLMQSRVEAVLFANPNCPSRVELLPCWEAVLCAARQFEQQLAALPTCGTVPTQPIVRIDPIQRNRPLIVPSVPQYGQTHPFRVPSQGNRHWSQPGWNANPRFDDPNWGQPRIDSRIDPRVDPRIDPRTAPRIDPRTDPRIDPRIDPRVDPRIDPRIDPRLNNRDVLPQPDRFRDLPSRVSPSERQLFESTRHIQRQPSFRQIDPITIGALISRLLN